MHYVVTRGSPTWIFLPGLLPNRPHERLPANSHSCGETVPGGAKALHAATRSARTLIAVPRFWTMSTRQSMAPTRKLRRAVDPFVAAHATVAFLGVGGRVRARY
jgi:hypothetical protein